MKRAFFLLLSATFILCTNEGARAQGGVSSGPSMVLIKGDTPTAPTPSCSFISTTELRPVPIVQGLFFVQRGDPPDQVESKMGSTADRPYANDVLQWTAVQGRNYVSAVVNFRNKVVLSRSLTMAINYQQPNEKRCQWEIREEEFGPQENPSSQPNIPNNPINPSNQVNQSGGTIENGKIIGGSVSYPRGSRINPDGIISTLKGERTIPTNSAKRGDGSTSYYYRDGSHINIKRNTIPPTGTPIR